jgi:hypothetical protein
MKVMYKVTDLLPGRRLSLYLAVTTMLSSAAAFAPMTQTAADRVSSVSSVSSFSSLALPPPSRTIQSVSTSTQLSALEALAALDTALLTDGAVAVAGLAAGVLSQVPQMRALEAQAAAAEADRDAQVKVLKDQLFALDREYEEGTADLKTQFDDLREVELSRQQKRQAEEFQFRWQAQLDEVRQEYDVQLARQKADLLSRQLEDVGTMTGDRQAELVTLRLEQTQLTERNNKLQALLDEAKGQIEELQSKNGSSFFDFLRRS